MMVYVCQLIYCFVLCDIIVQGIVNVLNVYWMHVTTIKRVLILISFCDLVSVTSQNFSGTKLIWMCYVQCLNAIHLYLYSVWILVQISSSMFIIENDCSGEWLEVVLEAFYCDWQKKQVNICIIRPGVKARSIW